MTKVATKTRRVLIAAAGALIIGACGGGGGGGRASSCPAVSSVADHYLAYSGSIDAVLASNFDTVIQLHASEQAFWTSSRYALDAAGKIVSVTPQSLVFVEQDSVTSEYQLRRASLRSSGGSQVPVRFSAEASSNPVCEGVLVSKDLLDPSDASTSFLYRLAGTDASCGTADDVGRRAFLSDGDTTAPDSLSFNALPLAQFYDSQGKLVSVLVRMGSDLNLYDADFQYLNTVLSLVSQVQVLSAARLDSVLLLVNNSTLRRVSKDGTASGALHTVSLGYALFADDVVNDANTVYFAEQRQSGSGPRSLLWRLAQDGADSVKMLETDEEILRVAPAATRLAFTTVPAALKTVAKSADFAQGAPAVATIDSAAFGFIDFYAGAGRLYYFIEDFSAGPTTAVAKVRREDGATVAGMPDRANAEWVGAAAALEGTLSGALTLSNTHLMLADGITDYDNTGHQGAILKSLDVCSGKESALTGTWESPGFFALGQIGTVGLGIFDAIRDVEPFFDTDVVAVDVATPRFRRITDTPGVSESIP